jgi:hypothetical protein
VSAVDQWVSVRQEPSMDRRRCTAGTEEASGHGRLGVAAQTSLVYVVGAWRSFIPRSRQ